MENHLKNLALFGANRKLTKLRTSKSARLFFKVQTLTEELRKRLKIAAIDFLMKN